MDHNYGSLEMAPHANSSFEPLVLTTVWPH